MQPEHEQNGVRGIHPARGRNVRVALMALAGVALIALAAGAGLLTGRLVQPTVPELGPEASSFPQPPTETPFAGWPKVDLALVLTGQMHGYLLPCGCSRPQRGGLERRYNFIQQLKQRGWPVLGADLGDLNQVEGPRNLPSIQGMRKYVVAMKALEKMGYVGISFGEYERKLPLLSALDEYAINDKKPRVVAANLDPKPQPDEVADWRFAPEAGENTGGIKVGVVGIIGKDLAKKNLGDNLQFTDGGDAIKRVLAEMNTKGVELRVLLYQGLEEKAKLCAQQFPQFQIILCLDSSDEPPSRPEMVGNTMVVTVGHKGKNIGVVGINRGAGGKLDLRYQRVDMGEEYETPKGQEASNPVLRIMEAYTAKLKADDVLKQYAQVAHPVAAAPPLKDLKPEYVGSKACESCHDAAYKVWKNTPHFHAYETLATATRPSNRQYDAECIVCHVTGFGYNTGFVDQNDKAFAILKGVGCEACHGPASEHVANPDNKALYALMNPWKFEENLAPIANDKRLKMMNAMCMKCHDADNDVNWTWDVFREKRWPAIEHHTPKKKK